MGELAEYELIDANGYVTTMMLDDADAKRLGAQRRTDKRTPLVDAAEVRHQARARVDDKARRPSRAG